MATAPNRDSPSSVQTETHRNLSLRNPLPLSASQEQEVKNIYYRRVRDKCAAEISEFAKCAMGRTISASFYCRREQQAMNSCMISNATPLEEDLAREEWFIGRDERQKKRRLEEEGVELRRQEVIRMQKGYEEKLHKTEEVKRYGNKVNAQGRWESGNEQERGRTWR